MRDDLRVTEVQVEIVDDAGRAFVARDESVEFCGENPYAFGVDNVAAFRPGTEYFMDVPPGVDAVLLTFDCMKGRLERGGWPTSDSAAADGEC